MNIKLNLKQSIKLGTDRENKITINIDVHLIWCRAYLESKKPFCELGGLRF
jgi:CDGSH-type Zn-finger protein